MYENKTMEKLNHSISNSLSTIYRVKVFLIDPRLSTLPHDVSCWDVINRCSATDSSVALVHVIVDRSWLHSTSSLVPFLIDHHIVNDTYVPSSPIVIGTYVILRLRDPWSVIVSIGCLECWYFLWCIHVMAVCVRFVVMGRVILLSCLFPWCVFLA